MIEDKLAQIGRSLPAAAKPAFAYVPVTLHDGVAYVSGRHCHTKQVEIICALG